METNKPGEYLKQLRKRKKLTLQSLGKKIGYSDAYISMVENSHKKNPSVDFLAKLAKGLEVSPDEIRKISNYYDIPYVVLMAEAGYVDEKGAVHVDSFDDLMMAPPSEIEKSKKEGTILAYGPDGFTHIEVDKPNKTDDKKEVEEALKNIEGRTMKGIDLYDLLNLDINLYYKKAILTPKEKEKINTLIQTIIED